LAAVQGVGYNSVLSRLLFRTLFAGSFLMLLINRFRRAGICLAVFAAMVAPGITQAHYMWITATNKDGSRTTDLVFEEWVLPGDGGYLDAIVKRAETTLRQPGNKPQTFELKEIKQSGKRWMQASGPARLPFALETYVKWGVYRYGKTDTLLHYYAKHVAGNDKSLLEPGKLAFDISHKVEANKAHLTVTWQGKPLPNAKIYIRGSKDTRSLVTNKSGNATLVLTRPALYTFRTKVIKNDESGEFEGKKYTAVHHNSTLTVHLAPR